MFRVSGEWSDLADCRPICLLYIYLSICIYRIYVRTHVYQRKIEVPRGGWCREVVIRRITWKRTAIWLMLGHPGLSTQQEKDWHWASQSSLIFIYLFIISYYIIIIISIKYNSPYMQHACIYLNPQLINTVVASVWLSSTVILLSFQLQSITITTTMLVLLYHPLTRSLLQVSDII